MFQLFLIKAIEKLNTCDVTIKLRELDLLKFVGKFPYFEGLNEFLYILTVI